MKDYIRFIIPIFMLIVTLILFIYNIYLNTNLFFSLFFLGTGLISSLILYLMFNSWTNEVKNGN